MDKLIYGPLEALGYGHPLHPVIVHLVIGPVVAALLVGLFGWIFKKPALLTTSRHLTVVAFVFWFFAVFMGVVDWIHFYHSAPIFAIFVKSIGASVLFIVLLTNILLFRKYKEASKVPFIFYTAAFICVMIIGLYGGNLVYGTDRSIVSAQPSEMQNGFNKVDNKDFTLMWKVNGKNLDVKISCTTTGWIGVGFGTTGTMMGSDIKIGYIKNGKAVILDSFGNEPDSHESRIKLGGKSTVTNVSGSEINGVTTLSFTRPLNSGEKNDVVLIPGNEYTIIMAHGPDGTKDFESYHDASRSMIRIKL